MERLVSFSLAVLVNALFVAAFAWSSTPVPAGEVLITDVTNGARITVASKPLVGASKRLALRGQPAQPRPAEMK